MQTQIIKQNQNLIEVSNYDQQNVEALMTPNLFFLNRPVKIKDKNYYRLIVWMDYKILNHKFTFWKEKLILNNFRLELFAKTNTAFEKISDQKDELKEQLILNFDEKNNRVVNDDNEYWTFLIDEKYLFNHELNLIYSLNFSNSNYAELLNEDNRGLNRGKIKINLESKLEDHKIIVPEIIAYLQNDDWSRQSAINYVILEKTYFLKTYDFNLINEFNSIILEVYQNTLTNLPLVILNQNYLKEIIYDFQNNFVSDDLSVNEIKVESSDDLKNYYQNQNLDYLVKKTSLGFEIILTSNWDFNFDDNKVQSTLNKQLIFNPMVKTNQEIKLNLNLSNKTYELRLKINQHNNIELVMLARDLTYLDGPVFNFNLVDELTYQQYLMVNNEIQKN